MRRNLAWPSATQSRSPTNLGGSKAGCSSRQSRPAICKSTGRKETSSSVAAWWIRLGACPTTTRGLGWKRLDPNRSGPLLALEFQLEKVRMSPLMYQTEEKQRVSFHLIVDVKWERLG